VNDCSRNDANDEDKAYNNQDNFLRTHLVIFSRQQFDFLLPSRILFFRTVLGQREVFGP